MSDFDDALRRELRALAAAGCRQAQGATGRAGAPSGRVAPPTRSGTALTLADAATGACSSGLPARGPFGTKTAVPDVVGQTDLADQSFRVLGYFEDSTGQPAPSAPIASLWCAQEMLC